MIMQGHGQVVKAQQEVGVELGLPPNWLNEQGTVYLSKDSDFSLFRTYPSEAQFGLRDGWRCQKCSSLENLQVHHRTRRSQQGDDALENLVTLCAYCHMAEHGQLCYSLPAARICSRPKPRRKQDFDCKLPRARENRPRH